MVTKDSQVAIGVPKTDVEDVKSIAAFDHIVGFEDEVGMIHSIAHSFERFGIRQGSVGLEYAFLPQPRMGMLIHPHAKPEAVVSKDCTPLMSELRLVKDEGEIERLRIAAKTAEAGIKAAVEALKPGMTESQLAAEAEYAMRQAGAEDFYRTYVASGPRTNLAHGVPTTKKMQNGDLVLIDVHPVVNGYTADMCRTVCIGQATEDQRNAHELYIRGLESAINKSKAGVTVTELEHSMHGVFEEAGHKAHIFGPPIHGVGIEFEESPLPAGHAFFHGEKAPQPLKSGVVIAIGNCGLYTGTWGVREEDTVVVGAEGSQVLTNYPRKLQP
jgi:Xaa-Pro aminopeptidase